MGCCTGSSAGLGAKTRDGTNLLEVKRTASGLMGLRLGPQSFCFRNCASSTVPSFITASTLTTVPSQWLLPVMLSSTVSC